MRKQTKIAALVSAAALLTIGAAMTSFAAWSMEGDQWVYLNSDGTKVESEWKSSYGTYYYLGEDGYMATNQLIDDDPENIYYVGADGRRVTNTWVSVPNEDDYTPNDQEVDTLWYYFGANGKAYMAKGTNDKEFVKKTVAWSGGSNIFFFDENGHMASGWMDYEDSDGTVNRYYLGDETEGWARAAGKNGSTGWVMLELKEEWEPSRVVYDSDFSYEDEEWFYFQSSGKAYKAKADKTTSKNIEGFYYTFDENGVLMDAWFDISSSASAASAYTGVDGVKTGWVYTTTKQDEDSSEWYYLVNAGDNKAMAFGSRKVDATDDDDLAKAKTELIARTIKGNVYVFNGLGQMKSGVVQVKTSTTKPDEEAVYDETGTPDKWNGLTANIVKLYPGYYVFSKDAWPDGRGKDGHMLTGKQSVTNDDGDIDTYNLAKTDVRILGVPIHKGQAYTNCIIDGYLYGKDGKLIKSEAGTKYEVVRIDDENRFGENATVCYKKNGSWNAYTTAVNACFLVDNNGKVRNAKTTYDDMVYEYNKDYPYAIYWEYGKGTKFTGKNPESKDSYIIFAE